MEYMARPGQAGAARSPQLQVDGALSSQGGSSVSSNWKDPKASLRIRFSADDGMGAASALRAAPGTFLLPADPPPAARIKTLVFDAQMNNGPEPEIHRVDP
jgi:hypothetical protein